MTLDPALIGVIAATGQVIGVVLAAMYTNHRVMVKMHASHITYHDKAWPDDVYRGEYKGRGWYVWDETQSSIVAGPFWLHRRARKASRKYGQFLDSQYNASR